MSKTKEQLELERLVNELIEKHPRNLSNSFIKCISNMSTEKIYNCVETSQNESSNL